MEGYLTLFAIVFFVGLTIFALRKKKRLEQSSIQEMEQLYGADNILLYDEKAMYYGLSSKGMIQTHEQGGIFVITKELVRFKSWDYGGTSFGVQVNFDFVIPLAELRGFGQAKKVAALGPIGKISGDGLLIIQFTNENGEEDELALLLKQRQAEAVSQLETSTGETAFTRR